MTDARISPLARALALMVALVLFAVAAFTGIAGAHAQERWGNIAAGAIALVAAIPFTLGVLVARSALTGRRVRALESEHTDR